MTHTATPEPFTPALARALMAALKAGLLALVDWLLRHFGAERRMPAHLRREVRQTLRDAHEGLFGLLVESYAHRLAPTLPHARVHDHRARRGVRSPTPSHRSAISLKRVLKRTLPKQRGTLRERFAAVFLILRRFERLLARFRAMLDKRYTSAWIVVVGANLFAPGCEHAPCARDSS